MSAEQSKPVFDERTLDKLLEAAFVLQEHNEASRKLAESLQKKRDQIEAHDRKAVSEAAAKSEAAPETALKKDVTLESIPKPATPSDYTGTLGRIVETQRQIQVRQLELHSALSLVAERVLEITRASGAVIGFVDGQFMHYRAVAGAHAPSADSTIPAAKALSFSCISTGQVLQCEDLDLEVVMDTQECRDRGIQSLIAAPVFLQGNVTGALELYYGKPRGFTDQDVHTCQLMAGLVTEALIRDEEVTWKKSLASERAAMLEALEKLQPNLAALVDKPGSRAEAGYRSNGDRREISICDKCGHELVAEEQFCGECGSPRTVEAPAVKATADVPPLHLLPIEEIAPRSTAKDAASAHTMGTASQAELEFQSGELEGSLADSELHNFAEHAQSSAISSEEEELPDFAEILQAVEEGSSVEESTTSQSTTPEEDDASEASTVPNSEATAIEKVSRPADWSSAAAAKDFLEKLAPGKGAFAQFWNARRGDIYLAISVILVICVILWGMMSSHSVGANGTQGQGAASHLKSPEANLSAWERMLISLGLAEAPAPPEDKGTPGTQVWVDERTGLYYCPGADLYGKTPKGKFTTQREAQLDEFEPAYRKPCN